MGKMSSLKPIITDTTNTTTTTKRKTPPPKKTRTMKISEPVYELCNHSRKYHDQPISYDEILEELCTFYNKNHEQKWFLT